MRPKLTIGLPELPSGNDATVTILLEQFAMRVWIKNRTLIAEFELSRDVRDAVLCLSGAQQLLNFRWMNVQNA